MDSLRQAVKFTRLDRSGLLLVFVLFLVPSALLGQQERLSVAEIAERAIPATVTVAGWTDPDSIFGGSGVIIREDGLIVTNWHVLDGATFALVILSTEETFENVRVLAFDSVADLAILKVPGADLPALPTTSETPRIGTPLVVVGNPYGYPQTVSDGILSGIRIIDGKENIQMTAPASQGSSGGPVLDEYGRVIGVTAWGRRGAENLNFAVPIRYALGMLNENPEPREVWEVFAPPEERRRRRDLEVQAAAAGAARIRRAEEEAAAQARVEEARRRRVEDQRIADSLRVENARQIEEQRLRNESARRVADSLREEDAHQRAEERRIVDSLRAVEDRLRTTGGFFARAGVAQPVYPETFKEPWGVGFSISGGYEIPVSDDFSVTLTGSFSRFGFDATGFESVVPPNDPPMTVTAGEESAFAYQGAVGGKVFLGNKSGSVRPFLLAGIGFGALEAAQIPVQGQTSFVELSRTVELGPVTDLGAGFSIHHGRMAFLISGQYSILFTNNEDKEGVPHFFSVEVGLSSTQRRRQ